MGKGKNRCVIYAFYDKDGKVDQYIFYMLKELHKIAEKIIFVANGKLNDESKRALIYENVYPVYRLNKGFDIWAYKTGIDLLGWKELVRYDEVVFMNDTVFGPVYPLEEIFECMWQRTVDFWGMTKHTESHLGVFKGATKYGYLPEHIQSFFFVCRRSLVGSYEFQKYWNELCPLNSYNDAVYKHEAIFTKHFSDMGFEWDVYVDSEDINYLTDNPMIYYPKEMIKRYHCSFFKRRVFFNRYDQFLQNTLGQPAIELYDYLKEETSYDINLIWDNLLRTCNMNDLFKTLHLNYTLPSEISHSEEMRNVLANKKTALIIHIYFEDLLDETYRYVSQMPDLCDVYITTCSEKMKVSIEEKFKNYRCRHFEVRIIRNRGRDVASILVGVKDIVNQYEYICFAHDKKSTQVNGSVGESFSYKCFENTLYSEDYIYNIIETFERNPRLGLLCPPEPNHADYSPTIGASWGRNANYKITLELAKEMGIKVPISKEKEAIAPFGSFFWFRYDALKAFYDKGWDYEDFPEEPLPPDGTISHAIERIRPFVAQQAGYYVAYVMTDKYARIEYTNLRTYVEDFNRAGFDNGYMALHNDLISTYKYLIKNELKKTGA